MKNIGNITLALWLATFFLGYFGLGTWLYEAMEGMDHCKITTHVDKLLGHDEPLMKMSPNLKTLKIMELRSWLCCPKSLQEV